MTANHLEAAPPVIRLSDVTAEAGIRFRHYSPLTAERHLHLVMGSGIGWLDFDRDGWPDLFCGQGQAWEPAANKPQRPAPTNRLFQNRGTGGFRDVTQDCGLADAFYAMGLAVGDFDNDGFADLYVSAFGPNRFYRNNGDGTFTECAKQLGIDDGRYAASCTWADIDADGNLDLFVTNYVKIPQEKYPLCRQTIDGREVHFVCHPRTLAAEYDVLYRNNGDGTFADATRAAGITGDEPRQGLGVVAADVDADGDVDFYVANDSVPNQLWINDGRGVFRERGLISGTALNRAGAREAGMGVAVGDVDGDGRCDLFVTNYYAESNTLYRNEGATLFTDITDELGLAAPSRLRLGFGTTLLDADNDGWLDLFVANGHVHDWLPQFGRDEPFAQLAQLFANREGRRFEDVSRQAGPYFQHPVVGRGSAAADYDRDGRSDLAVLHLNDDAKLLRNETETAGRFIALELVGTSVNRDAVGAVVELAAGNRAIVRLRTGSTSYLSADEAPLTVGIGPAETIERIRICWPGGERETWTELDAGRMHVLVEGAGARE